MSDSPSQMLAEFNETFEIAERETPGWVDPETAQLRVTLLREEFDEYLHAVYSDDLVELTDALADMVYIIYGTARLMGIPLDDVLAEVHRTNMAKAPGGVVTRRDDGKVLKPEGWVAPDIAGVLRAHGLAQR